MAKKAPNVQWTNDRRVDHLLDAARERIVSTGQGAPRQVNLRRAVSDIYYALFHFLVDRSTQNMIGSQPGEAAMRDAIARGFPHAQLKEACKSFGSGGALPKPFASAYTATNGVPKLSATIRQFAKFFVEIQELRHVADYDWNSKFVQRDIAAKIQEAQMLITKFRQEKRTADVRFFLG